MTARGNIRNIVLPATVTNTLKISKLSRKILESSLKIVNNKEK